MDNEQKRQAALALAGMVDMVTKGRDLLRTATMATLGAVEKAEDFLTKLEKQGTDMLEQLALDVAAGEDEGNPVADAWTGNVVDFSNGPVQIDDTSRVTPEGEVQLLHDGIWYDKSIVIDQIIKQYDLDDTPERRRMLANMPHAQLLSAWSGGRDDGQSGKVSV